MAVQVIKKDGKAEPFQRQKIIKSCTAVGAPVDVAASIADDIEKSARDQMPTSEIRAMVLEKLGKIRSEWAKNWEKYEQTKGQKK
ncbi:MAG: ATP cone domain-containing protein [Candidatus Hodarchaeaceae archaeon]|nr:ATP cone domain-containing protein [Candidatus Hodarchaeaceae archaeon]